MWLDFEFNYYWNIITRIHHLFRYFGTRGNIKSSRALEVEEKFDILVDANDQLLERVVCTHYLLSISEDVWVFLYGNIPD